MNTLPAAGRTAPLSQARPPPLGCCFHYGDFTDLPGAQSLGLAADRLLQAGPLLSAGPSTRVAGWLLPSREEAHVGRAGQVRAGRLMGQPGASSPPPGPDGRQGLPVEGTLGTLRSAQGSVQGLLLVSGSGKGYQTAAPPVPGPTNAGQRQRWSPRLVPHWTHSHWMLRRRGGGLGVETSVSRGPAW